MKSLSRVQFFATPWTVACQAPPSMGFFRQECWSGLPFPSPGDLPDPGIEPGSPALRAVVYRLSHHGSLHKAYTTCLLGIASILSNSGDNYELAFTLCSYILFIHNIPSTWMLNQCVSLYGYNVDFFNKYFKDTVINLIHIVFYICHILTIF